VESVLGCAADAAIGRHGGWAIGREAHLPFHGRSVLRLTRNSATFAANPWYEKTSLFSVFFFAFFAAILILRPFAGAPIRGLAPGIAKKNPSNGLIRTCIASRRGKTRWVRPKLSRTRTISEGALTCGPERMEHEGEGQNRGSLLARLLLLQTFH